jgi:hypothetical protein
LDTGHAWLVSKIKDSTDPQDWKKLDFVKNCTFKDSAKTAMTDGKAFQHFFFVWS